MQRWGNTRGGRLKAFHHCVYSLIVIIIIINVKDYLQTRQSGLGTHYVSLAVFKNANTPSMVDGLPFSSKDCS